MSGRAQRVDELERYADRRALLQLRCAGEPGRSFRGELGALAGLYLFADELLRHHGVELAGLIAGLLDRVDAGRPAPSRSSVQDLVRAIVREELAVAGGGDAARATATPESPGEMSAPAEHARPKYWFRLEIKEREGAAARAAGEPRDACPHATTHGGYRNAWLRGWDRAVGGAPIAREGTKP